jgi:pimeloyl-ACP methyl ester carboxylesterase
MTGWRLKPHWSVKLICLGCCCAILLAQAGCAPAEKPRPPATYTLGDCPYKLPTSYKVECGVLSVAENRSDPQSKTIQIQGAVVKTDNPSPAPDPVVYLAGGPGSSGSGELSIVLGPYSALLEKRDLVVVDQRGTGTSQPSLACPEYRKAYFEALGQQLPYNQFSAASMAALPACQLRLQSEGIDLSAYNNAESAADLEDLRQALGYEQWNLLGTSYGTRLALTVLRDYPKGVRSAILDSTFPPQVEPYSGWIYSQERAFRTLFDRCAADEMCSAAYPNLEQDFYALLDKLDAEPLIVEKANPFTQKKYEVLVDGDMLVNLIFLIFYDTTAIPHLPKLIEDALQGDTKTLARFMDPLFIIPSSIAWGMHYSVLCSTESVFTDYAQVEKDVDEAEPRLAQGMLNDHRLALETCAAWDRDAPGKEENRLVKSSVPTLVLSGEFDPVTPPEWGEQTAEALKHGYFYQFPGISHGVIWWNDFTNGCSNQLVLSFLDDPSQAPDVACLVEVPELEFFAP